MLNHSTIDDAEAWSQRLENRRSRPIPRYISVQDLLGLPRHHLEEMITYRLQELSLRGRPGDRYPRITPSDIEILAVVVLHHEDQLRLARQARSRTRG